MVGMGVLGDIHHRGTLAQGSHGKQLSRLGFLGSLVAVDRVWMQLSITSPSYTIIHVLSGPGSKLFSYSSLSMPMYSICQPIWSHSLPHSLLLLKPSPPQSLTAVFSVLMFHPPTTFSPPTPSNYCSGLTLQGLYSSPGKTGFPPVISQHFAGTPTIAILPSVFSA